MTSATAAFTHRPTLRGRLVRLRPVSVADAPGLVRQLHEQEGRRLTGTHGPIRPGVLERAEEYYRSRADADDELYLAIVDPRTDAFLGEVVLNQLEPYNRACNFRISLVGPHVYGRGFGTEATRLILAHAFEQAGINRVGLQVYAFNPRARRVYEKVGFVHEGTKRQALRWDGEWIDAEVMAILADEWHRHHGYPDGAE